MKSVEQIALERAEEQMQDEDSWRVQKYAREAEKDEIVNGRPSPPLVKREKCLAGDCVGKPFFLGPFAGYCRRHVIQPSRSGTIYSPDDFLIWPITGGHVS